MTAVLAGPGERLMMRRRAGTANQFIWAVMYVSRGESLMEAAGEWEGQWRRPEARGTRVSTLVSLLISAGPASRSPLGLGSASPWRTCGGRDLLESRPRREKHSISQLISVQGWAHRSKGR